MLALLPALISMAKFLNPGAQQVRVSCIRLSHPRRGGQRPLRPPSRKLPSMTPSAIVQKPYTALAHPVENFGNSLAAVFAEFQRVFEERVAGQGCCQRRLIQDLHLPVRPRSRVPWRTCFFAGSASAVDLK